ncbi:16S rRNA (guanine(527)-N(7))-methyltransferase RsmG [Nocardioides aestuarii]|uniref:Ribosomal RNA small subunit methyltransferase G n=1 Tax=Nocardioides aestuarii TaxID=252231 RepID=A0ABW4TM46_9ACTN
MFGSGRLRLAEQYAAWLAGEGVVRGVIGPREVPRLWDRHLLGCAVVSEAVSEDVSVADVGSGAGLPGLVLAIARPDLTVTLIEPLLRRTTFLQEVVDDLGLTNVEVVRARAEELHGQRTFDVVTSRAVAALDKLLGWCVPLTAPDGAVLAMKGGRAAEEIAAATKAWRRLQCTEPEVLTVGAALEPPTTLVRVVRRRHGVRG